MPALPAELGAADVPTTLGLDTGVAVADRTRGAFGGVGVVSGFELGLAVFFAAESAMVVFLR